MRIACIATSEVPSLKANSIRIMKVCQSFIDLGHTVKLWLPGRSPKVSWQFLSEHYGIRDQFHIRWIRAARGLRRYDFCSQAVVAARLWRADLYHTWPLQAAALASRLGLPTVLEVHDQPRGRLGPWLFQQFLKGSGARRLLPITEALRAWLASSYSVDLGFPFAVIAPMGVDIERYKELPSPSEARRQLKMQDSFTVGYTGHLYPGRGIDLLLELARRNPLKRFIWAGGEPAAVERWRRRLSEIGVDNVQVLGFVANERLPLVQAACDVLLMPYERRISVSSGGDTARFTSPMKVFEYLASARAIISSNLPVLREVLNESNSILLPPEDIMAWNEALGFLAADKKRRQALGAQAYHDAAKYTWLKRARLSLEGLDEKHVS
jgi:glycosyltransferase involved in cell wall biosynthesis